MGSQLKRLTMYSKVKNLFEKGLSISQISCTTKLDLSEIWRNGKMREKSLIDSVKNL